MLTAITGLPGSGKTLLAVTRLMEGQDQGRPLYANINGLVLEHTSIADWRKEGRDKQEFADMDRFAEIPNHALIVIDEAHTFFGAGMGKQMPTAMRTWFATHRHRRQDIVLIYQAAEQITNQMKVLIGDHFHVRRASGLGLKKWSRITFYKEGVEKLKIWSKLRRDNRKAYAMYQTDAVGGAEENAGMAGGAVLLKPMLAIGCAGAALLFLFYRLMSGSFSSGTERPDEGLAGEQTSAVETITPTAPQLLRPSWFELKVCDINWECQQHQIKTKPPKPGSE